MRLPPFEYHTPQSLKECADLLGAFGKEAVLVSGGTDLFVRMKQRLLSPAHLISLSGIDGIDVVSADPDSGLTIGAGVRLADIVSSTVIRDHCQALSEAAHMVAGNQVRQSATVGGNLFQQTRCLYYNRTAVWRKAVVPCIKRGGKRCHAVPGSKRCFAAYQGDMAPLLIALRARALLFRDDRIDEVPLEEMFTGDGASPFREGTNLLFAIRVPPMGAGSFASYRKYRLRNGVDFALAGAALSLMRTQGRVAAFRLCLTGVASGPLVVKKAEELVLGNALNHPIIEQIAGAVFGAAHPVANIEGTPSRRRSMARLLTGEMLQAAATL